MTADLSPTPKQDSSLWKHPPCTWHSQDWTFEARITQIPSPHPGPNLCSPEASASACSRGRPETGHEYRGPNPLLPSVLEAVFPPEGQLSPYFNTLTNRKITFVMRNYSYTIWAKKYKMKGNIIKMRFMNNNNFLTGWKICSEWRLNTVSGILHCIWELPTILCST